MTLIQRTSIAAYGRGAKTSGATRSLSDARNRIAMLLVGLAALAVYAAPKVTDPTAHWPLWDVNVYRWGGQQAVHGGALYASSARYSFTYPPFAAALFALGAGAPVGVLDAVITFASVFALALVCWLALRAVDVRPRPETVLAATSLALLMQPVTFTLHLGEVNLILAALVATDLLRRRDGGRTQGLATGVAAGIKLTPLIFVPYLLATRRIGAATTATASFAATVALGFVLLPSQSRTFWLDGVFLEERRIGNPNNTGNQSLSGLVARGAGNLDSARPWWLIAAALTGVAGIAIAAAAHRHGQRLAGVSYCGITGLLVSPFSWTHHWVWAVPLLIALATTAWRRNSLRYGIATVIVAIGFSGVIPLHPSKTEPPTLRITQSNTYVLIGLAALATAALGLAREYASAGRTTNGGPSLEAMARRSPSSRSQEGNPG
jgi:alpha-1,2-mannosyltransferase